MSTEVVTSLTSRVASLEDIIRSQESTLTTLLSRLRDVEQFVGAEARNREQNQQQLTQLLGDRSGAAMLGDKLDLLLQNQNERISALQAEAQGHRAALQGVDSKYDSAFRGLEQRLQGDVAACYDRIKAGETATGDALRTAQSALQGVNAAVQQVDLNARDAAQQLQQQMQTELAALRQRGEALEGSVRGALQEVHGSLSGDINALDSRVMEQLRAAVSGQNAAMQTLDDRVRADVTTLGQKEQSDVAGLQQRLDEGLASVQASLQSAHNALSSEVANVAQHSQGVDAQQRASHQTLLQELSKQDQHLEAVDNSWRASVLELRGTTQQETAAVREQALAGDRALQEQLSAARQEFGSAAAKLGKDIEDLTKAMQERCVAAIEQVNVVVTRHGERILGLQGDAEDVRQQLRLFAGEVERNATQFRTVMETALRASHSDLVERINIVSAAAALRSDPETVHAKINQALTTIWNDASGTFATQRDVGDILKKIASLESAVRGEVVALTNEDGGLHRRIDELHVAQQRLQLEVTTAADAVSRVRGGGGGGSFAADGAPARQEGERGSVADGGGDEVGISSEDVAQFRVLLENAREVALDVVDSARVAEAAQDESVTAANEARQLLAQMQELHRVLLARSERTSAVDRVDESPKGQGRPPISPTPVTGSPSGEASGAERPPSSRALVPLTKAKNTFMLQTPAEVSSNTSNNNNEGPPRRGTSPSTARALQLQQDLSAPVDSPTYYLVDGNRGSGAGGGEATSPPGSRPPSATTGKDRRTPTTEILMPTHMFVRKKEYANFKEFTKKEIDALWVELLGLKRTQGLGREEVNLLIGQMKQTILTEMVAALTSQEREIITTLHGIRAQVDDMSAKPPLYMTDMKVLQSSRPLEQALQGQRAVRAVVSPSRARAIESQEPSPKSSSARRRSADSPTSSARSSEGPLPARTISANVRRASHPPRTGGSGVPQPLDDPVLFAELSSAELAPIHEPPRRTVSPMHTTSTIAPVQQRAAGGGGGGASGKPEPRPSSSPSSAAVAPAERATRPSKERRAASDVPAFVRQSRRLSLTDEIPSANTSPMRRPHSQTTQPEPRQGGGGDTGSPTDRSRVGGPLVHQPPLARPRTTPEQPLASSAAAAAVRTPIPNLTGTTSNLGFPHRYRSGSAGGGGGGKHPYQQPSRSPYEDARPPYRAAQERKPGMTPLDRVQVFEELPLRSQQPPYKTTSDLAAEHDNLLRHLGQLVGRAAASKPPQPLAEPGKPWIGGAGGGGAAAATAPPVREEAQPYGSRPNSTNAQRRRNPTGNSFHLHPMAHGGLPPAAADPFGLPVSGSTPPQQQQGIGAPLRPYNDDEDRMSSVSAPRLAQGGPAPGGGGQQASPLGQARQAPSPSNRSHSSSPPQRRPASGSQRGLHAIPVDASTSSSSSSPASSESTSSSDRSEDDKNSRASRLASKRSTRHRRNTESRERTNSKPRKQQTSRPPRRKPSAADRGSSRRSSSKPRSSHRDANSEAPHATPSPQRQASIAVAPSVRVLPSSDEPVRVGGNYAAPLVDAEQIAPRFPQDSFQMRIATESRGDTEQHPYASVSRGHTSAAATQPYQDL